MVSGNVCLCAERNSRKRCGTALYEKMEELLKKQNIVNLFACITHPNAESEAFHAARGYEKKAHFEQCGYKQQVVGYCMDAEGDCIE